MSTNLTTNGTHYWKMDEASGNPADSIGSATLTNTNGTFSACKIQNGAVFNKTAYMSIASGNVPTGSLTFAFWYYVTDVPGTGYQILADWSSTKKNIYITYNADKTLQFYRGNGGSSQSGVTYVTLSTTSTWYHIVWTMSGSASNIYVNAGTPTAATLSQTGGATGNTAYFGCYTDLTLKLNGKLDEVGFWSSALSAQDVKELYSNGGGNQYPFGAARMMAFM